MPFIPFDDEKNDGFISFENDDVAPKPKTRNPLAFVNDTVIELANAVVNGIGAVADFVSPGNRASSAINEFVREGEEKQSDITKADRAKFRERLDQSQGVSDDLSAVGRYLLDSPIQAAAQAVGSFAGPGFAVAGSRAGATALGATAKMATRIGRGAGIATGAAMGGGDAAGDAYALVQNMPDDVILTNKEVAQMYASGMSLDDIRHEVGTLAARQASVLPAIAGGAAGAFGAEKLLAGGVARAGARGALKAGAIEGAGEAAEEGLAQYEGRRAAQEYDPSIDPTKNVAAMAAMGGVMGFGAGAGLNALSAKPQESIVEPPVESPATLQLGYNESPQQGYGTLIVFPDGSTGTREDVESFIASIPEQDRNAARARLYGMEPQPYNAEDVLQTQSADEAIIVANRAIEEATPFEREKKAAEIDAAWQAYQADITAQRDRDFVAALQVRRDADAPLMQAENADDQVAQAQALTAAQGFDEQPFNAMQLALRDAEIKRIRAIGADYAKSQQQQAQQVEAERAAAFDQRDQEQSAARQQEFEQAQAARQNTDSIGAVIEGRQQEQELGNSIAADVGMPTAQPSAMQLAFQQAQAMRQERLAEAQQRTKIQTQQQDIGKQDERVTNNIAEVGEGLDTGINSSAVAIGNSGNNKINAGVDTGNNRSAGKNTVSTIDTNATDSTTVRGNLPQSSAGSSISVSDDGAASRKSNAAANSGNASTEAVERAREILTAAGITGNERMTALRAIRSGENTLDDLIDAHPPKERNDAAPAANTVQVPDEGSAGVANAPQVQQVTAPAVQTLAQPDTEQKADTASTDVAGGTGVSGVGGTDGQAAALDEIRRQNERPFARKESTGARADFASVERQQSRLEAEIEKARANAEARKNKPKKSEAPARGGMRAEDVNRSLTMLRAKWLGSGKVNTVQSLDDLPVDVRELASADEKTEGLYNPQTGQVYLIADNISTPERAAWVSAHEKIGHGGLRALKDKTVNEALNMAGANKFVKDLAAAIGKERGTDKESLTVEEAVAELAAAIETNDFQALETRYGVQVPASARNGIRATIARVIDSIKRFLASAIGKPMSSVSDADVRELIGAQREAVSQQTESAPQETADEAPMQSRAAGNWDIPAMTKFDDLIHSLQDKQIDMKRIVSEIKDSGKSISDNFNPYLQEELFYGRSAKGVKDFLNTELRPLVQEMQMRKVEISDFEEYLWNRHAEERNNQIASLENGMKDKGSGITTKDARAYLSALPTTKRTAYEALAKRIDAINAKTRDILVASGLEKQSTIDAWSNAYKYYVPLQREDVETGGNGTGQGFSIKGGASKRAVGSDKPVADIIANIAMQRERQIVRAEKNRVSTALLGLATQNPNADFWDVDNAPTERVVELRGGKDTVVERIVPGFRSRDNVVMARINGKDHFITFNERDPRAVRMAQAIKNLDADQLGRVLSATSKATRYLAAINTQYNPIFGIINLMRDTQGAMLNLSTTPIAGEQKKVLGYTGSALLGIYADLRAHRAGKQPTSVWANLFEEFQNEGGQTGYRDQYGNAEQRSEAIAKEIKSINQHPALKAGGAIFGWLSDYNESMENAVRLAAYRTAKESGMSNQQAASVAKNLTVNFNRKGQVATQIGALYAFFNASTQGTARLAETLTGPMGKKIIMGGILLGAMQAMLLASSDMGDDEPPEFVRSRSLILPIGDKKYLTLPMPLGFHVLPNLGRIPMEFMLNGFRNPTKRIADLVGVFADTFNPIGNAGISLQTIAPSLVDPFAALAENRDWTGKPIAREDINSLAPTPGYTRANDTATTWSKAISYGLNILSGGTDYKPGLVSPTPDQLDYLIGQATGGVGRELSKFDQVRSSLMTGEDLPVHKIPLYGRFVGNASGQAAEKNKFYASIKRINEHEAEINGLREDKKTDELRKYISQNKDALLIKFANKTEYDLRQMKKAKREAIGAGNFERVKLIEERIAFTMSRFNKRVESLRVE